MERRKQAKEIKGIDGGGTGTTFKVSVYTQGMVWTLFKGSVSAWEEGSGVVCIV